MTTPQPNGTRLSARTTVLSRVVIPLLWIVALGPAILAPWVGMLTGGGHEPFPWLYHGILLAAWVFGIGVFVTFALSLRDVWIEGDHLRLRGWHGEEELPLVQIDRVKESLLLKPRLVYVYPLPGDGRPDRFAFIPAQRRWLPLGLHPVIAELREEIEAHGGRAASDHTSP